MSKSGRQLISSKADFPRVKIYREDGAGGPVYTIAFRNREERARGPKALILITALVGGVMALAVMPIISIACVVIFIVMAQPANERREIALDFGKGELRVYRSGALEIRKQLALANLTIERHPEAEQEWHDSGGKLGIKQKQHCLVGWFGAAGADRADLVCRVEWPRKDSLLEVRQAILWAMQQAQQEAGAVPGHDEYERQTARTTMAPPLD